MYVCTRGHSYKLIYAYSRTNLRLGAFSRRRVGSNSLTEEDTVFLSNFKDEEVGLRDIK